MGKKKRRNRKNQHIQPWDDAIKILKYTKKRCPDCDESNLVITEKDISSGSGVIYWEKYYECPVCGYCKAIKERHTSKTQDIIDIWEV